MVFRTLAVVAGVVWLAGPALLAAEKPGKTDPLSQISDPFISLLQNLPLIKRDYFPILH